jgi:hypothetical protein
MVFCLQTRPSEFRASRVDYRATQSQSEREIVRRRDAEKRSPNKRNKQSITTTYSSNNTQHTRRRTAASSTSNKNVGEMSV